MASFRATCVRRLRFGLNSLASAFAFAGVLVEFGLLIAFVPAFSRSTQHFDDRGVVCVTAVIEPQKARVAPSRPFEHAVPAYTTKVARRWRQKSAKCSAKKIVIDR